MRQRRAWYGFGALPGVERDTGQIKSFSDGVFSIAITLLKFEVPQPSGRSESTDLLHALLGLWPSLFPYILSFVMIGTYWARHHYIFRYIGRQITC